MIVSSRSAYRSALFRKRGLGRNSLIPGCAVQKIHNTFITDAYGDGYEIGKGRATATALKNHGGSHPLKT